MLHIFTSHYFLDNSILHQFQFQPATWEKESGFLLITDLCIPDLVVNNGYPECGLVA